MNPIETLLSRASVSDLQDPAPAGAVLDQVLESALRAPDHGKLRPWRFVLIRGAARQAWSEAVIAALHARDPAAPEAQVQKQRNRALNTPLIIAMGVHVQDGTKIPEIEQMLCAGAAAMNMLNALHALGFGGVWLTGPAAYDPSIIRTLGLAPTDKLAGFLFVGTPKQTPQSPRRPDLANFVTEWAGAPAPALV